MVTKLLPTNVETAAQRKIELTNPSYRSEYPLRISSVYYVPKEGKPFKDGYGGSNQTQTVSENERGALRFFPDGLECIVHETQDTNKKSQQTTVLVLERPIDQNPYLIIHYTCNYPNQE